MSALSGSITLQVNVQDTLPAGANRQTPYKIPYQPPDTTVSFQGGTGPNSANKFAQLSGSAAAAVVDTDLTSVTCDDASIGFAHVREVIVWNDDPTNILTIGLGANPFTPFLGGTGPTVIVEAGSHRRFNKPNGTNGWPTSTGAKVLRIDPGANTIAYRIFVAGD